MAERHHDLLRQLYSKIRFQANEEGIPYDDDDILAMAVMAKNCMTTVGQYSHKQQYLEHNPAYFQIKIVNSLTWRMPRMGYLAATPIVFVKLPYKKLSLLLQDRESKQRRILVRDKRFNLINTSTETTLNFGENLLQNDCQVGVALLKSCMSTTLMQ